MTIKQKQPNEKLRYEREIRGWSQKRVADAIDTSKEVVGLWERGERITGKKYQERLCNLFGKSAEELGFMKDTRKLESSDTTDFITSSFPEQDSELQKVLSVVIQNNSQDTIGKVQELDGRDLDKLRRLLLKSALGLTLEEMLSGEQAQFVTKQSPSVSHVSELAIAKMRDLTLHYRDLQRMGTRSTEAELHNHVALIQYTLENTIEDQYRRELWRVLSLTQILLRHYYNGKDELAKAKTWNEGAISSAQRSNDSLLIGGAIGHLAHLYLMKQTDVATAYQLLESAEEYIGTHAALKGWFAVIKAVIASRDGNKQHCNYWLLKAEDLALGMPQIPAYVDTIFTEFDQTSVDSWSGYCLLGLNEPSKAYERLLQVNPQILSERRQADYYQDIAKACLLTGEPNVAQKYIFQSIDKAVAVKRIDTISRSITLVEELQKKDVYASHTAKIVEYAQNALQKVKGE